MYNEKTFKNYIFWTKVRRIFLILLFSIIGCLIGKFVSSIIATITTNNSYEILIISISTLSFFALSLLLTIGTAREVQDAYWKMAVLRKLSTMSKKIDSLGASKSSSTIKNSKGKELNIFSATPKNPRISEVFQEIEDESEITPKKKSQKKSKNSNSKISK